MFGLKRLLLRLRATISTQHNRDTRSTLESRLRHTGREGFSFHPIEDLVRDLRYAARGMRRFAGFTAIAVSSLAVGIGAATATFAVIEAVMLRPLPVRSPERLVAFTTAADSGWATWSYAAFARWRRASDGLYDAAAASDVRRFPVTRGNGGSPEDVPVSLVSATAP